MWDLMKGINIMLCTTCKIESDQITMVAKKPYCLPCGQKQRDCVKKLRRRLYNQCYLDLGLTKVRGGLGGVYWE